MKKPIETYKRFDIVKIPFPFIDGPVKKIRPALILSSAISLDAKISSSIMAMITSLKPKHDFWSSDVIIDHFTEAGLPVASIVRFKIFTLDHRLILGHLGTLSKTDQNLVRKKVREVFVD